MRVLVACEFSGMVRDAFLARGHDAHSCDFLPSERPGPHYQRDVLEVLDYGWDLLIAHPSCTHIAVSGARWFKEKRADGRQQAAVEFFMRLVNAKIPKICVENPVCIMSRLYRKPDQIIQPWQFGHGETKAPVCGSRACRRSSRRRSLMGGMHASTACHHQWIAGDCAASHTQELPPQWLSSGDDWRAAVPDQPDALGGGDGRSV